MRESRLHGEAAGQVELLVQGNIPCTLARELVLIVKYGMSPLVVLQANLISGAKLLDGEGQIGVLEPDYLADIIAVSSDPLQISEQCKTSDL